MKKILVIILSVFAFVACSKDDYAFEYPSEESDSYGKHQYFAQFIERGLPKKLPKGWCREEPHGEYYSKGSNPFSMSFVDEEGNSLLDANDLSTWPVPMCFRAAEEDPDNYYANMTTPNERYIAYVAQGESNELPIFHMMDPCDSRHTNSFKLRILGKEYDMTIVYIYSEGAAGGCCYPHIFRWEINGELMYSSFESRYNVNGKGTSRRAVVTIKKDGTISVERIWVK